MGQPAKVPRSMGDSRVLPLVWERGCHPHTPLHPSLALPVHALPGFFLAPILSARSHPALWLCWVCFQCLLKDNAQMGALVGGLGWAGLGGLANSGWQPCAAGWKHPVLVSKNSLGSSELICAEEGRDQSHPMPERLLPVGQAGGTCLFPSGQGSGGCAASGLAMGGTVGRGPSQLLGGGWYQCTL